MPKFLHLFPVGFEAAPEVGAEGGAAAAAAAAAVVAFVAGLCVAVLW